MKIVRSIPQLRSWVARARRDGKTLGFVPTMGALHAGHVSLIHRARRAIGPHGGLVVSIFVNPTQFNQKSDLKQYPRRPADDARICRDAGADLLFAPDAAAIYPPDFSTWVEETALSRPLCGARRPGHFRGVCTVVLKLFNLVQPDVAIFGQKDAQQALVVRRMVRDLNVPVRVLVAPTIREPAGLAMSSRNQRLSPGGRQRALVLSQALRLARAAFQRGERRAVPLKRAARRHLRRATGVRLDYLDLVSAATLKSVSRASRGDLLAVAAWVDRVRLIDNLRL